jgi:hypothetical protein
MKNIFSYLVGMVFALVGPFSFFVQKYTKIKMVAAVYFLGPKISYLSIGYRITDFVLMFLAGLAVSWLDKKYDIDKLIGIGIVAPILGIFVNYSGSFDFGASIFGIILGLIYINLGGLFYNLVSKK